MSETEVVQVGEPFRTIATVAALDRFKISVLWHGMEHPQPPTVIDLAPDVYTFKVYAPLRDDPGLFGTIHVIEGGAVIAWGPDDRIDMHVSTIERLADEVMTPRDFQGFLKACGFTRDAAAAQLGISRRLIGYYVEGQAIPRHIVLACKYLSRQRGTQASA